MTATRWIDPVTGRGFGAAPEWTHRRATTIVPAAPRLTRCRCCFELGYVTLPETRCAFCCREGIQSPAEARAWVDRWHAQLRAEGKNPSDEYQDA